MTDPSTIELTTPLPDNALGARLTWQRDRGRLRGDEDVPRAEATRAVLVVTGLDGKERERRLSVAEADAYLAEVAALHDRSARKDAELAQRRVEAQEQRAELAATIDLRCRHCGTPPRHAGRRNLVSLGAPEHVAREDLAQLARPETAAYEEYVCPTCGAVELFRAGTLEHPLPGTVT